MEENIKNRIILILVIVTAMLLIGNVSSCGSAYRNKVARDREIASRIELEEKMSTFSQEKAAIEQKLAATAQSLEEEKAAHQATKKALLQEQLVSQSLKEELQKVTKLKEALEEDLKEALVAAKAAKPRQ